MKLEQVFQITAPHFCAGGAYERPNVNSKTARVKDAAPIIHYMVGWSIEEVKVYCHKKRWKYEIVKAYSIPQ